MLACLVSELAPDLKFCFSFSYFKEMEHSGFWHCLRTVPTLVVFGADEGAFRMVIDFSNNILALEVKENASGTCEWP